MMQTNQIDITANLYMMCICLASILIIVYSVYRIRLRMKMMKLTQKVIEDTIEDDNYEILPYEKRKSSEWKKIVAIAVVGIAVVGILIYLMNKRRR